MDTIRESDPGANHPGKVGATVDRFVLVEKLGAGGMGEVFLARDPQLNRQVALKLLKRSPTDDDQAMGRLLREARAMAQVSHPNVVSVFDAGMHGEQPWVAMEWIRGHTLREWLRTPHPWPQTLALLCDIGRGLQAAHDAGLVHRDLKPENVLVGDNGRVAVTDFGLAHGAWADVRPELATPAALPIAARATHAGLLMGTPGYMAPEQSRRQPTDARTDQFAFAITAYEALYGVLPFTDDNAAAPKPPPPSKVPPRVWRALERGLQAEQNDRHPSVSALVGELHACLPKSRASAWGLLIATLCVLLAAGFTFFATRQQPCDAGPKLLAPTWNPQRKAAVEAALKSSAGAVGAAVAPQVLAQLDAWAQRWTQMEQQSCEATKAGSQSATLLDLRAACLRRRLGDLDALVSLLASEGAALAGKADTAVASLASVDGCADETTLGGRIPVPAASATAVEALDKGLSRVKAMEDLGQYRDALAPAKAQAAQAREAGYAPALAEALVELGRTQNLAGSPLDAEPTLEDAVNSAEVARDDRLRAAARLLRVQVLLGLKKLDDAERELRAAAAVVQRVDAPELKRDLKGVEADLATAQGRLDESVALAQQSLDAAEKLTPPDERKLVAALGTYAFSLVRAGKLADAEKQYARAIPIAERALGPKNPGLAKLLGEQVGVLGKLRRLDEARALHARANEIITASLGADSAMMGDDLSNWGTTLLVNRQLDEAKTFLEKGLELRRRTLPPNHPSIAMSINRLGVLAAEVGNYDECTARFKETIALREKALGPTHPQVLSDINDLGGAYALAGKHVEALATFDEALAREKRQVGTRLSDTAKAQIVMGRAEELLGLYRWADAREGLAQSHDAAMKTDGPDLKGRQLLLEAWVAWDGFGEKDATVAKVAEARPFVEEVGDPEMIRMLDGILTRMKAGKRNVK